MTPCDATKELVAFGIEPTAGAVFEWHEGRADIELRTEGITRALVDELAKITGGSDGR